MKKILLLLVILAIWNNNVKAEGVWSVNGYHLSNVNVLHKLNTVHVSGRIYGGKYADYLKIRILISNDSGYRRWAETSLQRYSGKGELFESQFKYYKKSRIWNIEQVDVIGNSVGQTNSKKKTSLEFQVAIDTNQQYQENLYKYAQDKEYKQKSFPSKRKITGKTSRVLFSSFSNVSIIIRDNKTNKAVLMRNISPHNLEEIIIEKGSYTATIIGNNFKREKTFTIIEDSETVSLN